MLVRVPTVLADAVRRERKRNRFGVTKPLQEFCCDLIREGLHIVEVRRKHRIENDQNLSPKR